MIRSFACDHTESLFHGARVYGVGWEQVQKIARRKLLVLHAVTSLSELRVPINNHLEALRRDREGQHSIRVNDQWRICFIWYEDGPGNVEIVDYH